MTKRVALDGMSNPPEEFDGRCTERALRMPDAVPRKVACADVWV